MKLKLNNKKALFILAATALLLVGVFLILWFTVFRQTPRDREIYFYDNLSYRILDDGRVEITGYVGTDAKIVIPSVINNRTVKSIGEGAFFGVDVTNLTVGSFVTRIEKNAFYGCASLSAISFEGEIEYVGDSAFYGCSMLTSITFTDKLSYLGEGAFYGCHRLSEIELPDSITDVGKYTFAYCEALTSLPVREDVRTVGDYAFLGCKKLKSVKLTAPQSVGAYAFSECEELTEVDFGSVGFIGESCLEGAVSVETVAVDEGSERYSTTGGALVDLTDSTVLYFPPKSDAETYTLPLGVKRIAPSSFYKCDKLSSVVLSDTVEYIGSYAFFGCSALESFFMPSGAPGFPKTLRYVGGLAFADTAYYSSLKSEINVIGDGVLIKYNALRNSSGNYDRDGMIYSTVVERLVEVGGVNVNRIMGVSVTLPEGIKCISSAFADNSSVVEVKLPATATVITDSAFLNAAYLEKADMSLSAIKEIGTGAFKLCRVLNTVVFPAADTLTELGELVFFECFGLETVALPRSLQYVGDYMFAGCTSLKSVDIPDTVTRIGTRAFNGTVSLKSIAIPQSVKTVGEYAFCESGLESFTLKGGVSYGEFLLIGSANLKEIIIEADSIMPRGVCMSCISLTSVRIMDGVDVVSSDAFYGCESLVKITLPRSVKRVDSSAFENCYVLSEFDTGGRLEYIGHSAFRSCSSLACFEFDRSVKEIGDYAFFACESLKDVDLKRIEQIGAAAFGNCTSLTEINLKSVYFSISPRAFSGCSSLTDIKMSESVTEIGTDAFSGCLALGKISLPDSLVTLGAGAFMGCRALYDIDWSDNLKYIYNDAFYMCTALTRVDLPDTLVEIGDGVFNGCSSLGIVKMGDEVTEIGRYAFKDCSSLYEIELSDSLFAISSECFSGCAMLVDIEIPEGVREIEKDAFLACTNLRRVSLPRSLNAVRQDAFYGCASLERITYGAEDAHFGLVTVESGNDSLLYAFYKDR